MGSPVLKDPDIRRTLARNINRLLVEHGLSQNRLAQRSGVNQKQVNNVCQQRTGCGIDALARIAEALQVRPCQLLEDESPSNGGDRQAAT